MNLKAKTKSFRALLLILGVVLIASCDTTTPGDEINPDTDPGKTDSKVDSGDVLTPVDGKIFSIPSPIQLSLFIKKSGLEFNKELLNETSNVDKYTNLTRQALNLGVYGADLGYTSIYEQSQESILRMKSVRKLSDQLGITEAFDNSLVERIEKNIENKDSLLALVSSAYRDCDDYLKRQKQENIGALIVTGGWIESLYFAAQISGDKPDAELMKRVGEQKRALGNLIEMLVKYMNEAGVEDIYNVLIELEDAYQDVEIKYGFVKPEVDEDNKITYLKCTSETIITEETFNVIKNKIISLRNQIVE